MDNQIQDLAQILSASGTGVSAVVVFLLWRLNKEVGELKVFISTYTEVMSKYIPGVKGQ